MGSQRQATVLLTDIAARLDVPIFSTTTFVTQDTMVRWLEVSGLRFNAFLIRSYGEDYFSATDEFDTVSGQNNYLLPADYYQSQFLRTEIGGSTWKIRRGSRESLDRERQGQPGWNVGLGPVYRIVGNEIIFAPRPIGIHKVRHHYVPNTVFRDFGTGDPKSTLTLLDLVEVPWASQFDWLVLDCCRKHRVLEEQDPSGYLQEMAELQQEIIDDSGRRDGEPKRIKNTYDLQDDVRLRGGFR